MNTLDIATRTKKAITQIREISKETNIDQITRVCKRNRVSAKRIIKIALFKAKYNGK